MGDLNAKRGRIQGSASLGGGEVEIVAHVPTSEVLRYAIDLRSMTGGRGRFTIAHSHYDPVPAHLVDKVVAGAPRNRVSASRSRARRRSRISVQQLLVDGQSARRLLAGAVRCRAHLVRLEGLHDQEQHETRRARS